jgi:hypothetical protein
MIQRRLDDHIRYARQVYAQLAEGKGAGVARLLEKHLETVSRAKNPGAFARDLGGALARAEGQEGSDLRPTASANRS